MATGNAPAHRSLYGIRPTPSTQSQPHTPTRSSHVLPSSYGSPSTVRADDDFVLVEIGSRFVRAGFAGDSSPKAVLGWSPEQQRRVGDFGAWEGKGPVLTTDVWAGDYEIWRFDLRGFDLDLFQHRLDRLLRDAFTRFLLIDSRPRKMGLVIDPAVPIPLLSAVLDTLFNNFQAPVVSLLSSPTMSAVAAGVRSALVVDMGWAETVVTSVYEYREVKTTRSIRGGSRLLDGLYNLLRSLLEPESEATDDGRRVVGFDECEDVMCRLMWCRGLASKSPRRLSAQLDTVEEQDESGDETAQTFSRQMEIPLRSTDPPTTVNIPFAKLADVCDDCFFDGSSPPSSFDDHELPVHLLVYQHLLQLPMDVRAVCMSRLMFTGGCSETLGLKGRIVDEVTTMVETRGWAPVTGKAYEQTRSKRSTNKQARRLSGSSQRWSADSSQAAPSEPGEDVETTPSESGMTTSTTATEVASDPVEAKISRNRPRTRQFQGELRAIQSLGGWAGASLACHVKMAATATMDREQWLQQGAGGASRPGDVDGKAQQRHGRGYKLVSPPTLVYEHMVSACGYRPRDQNDETQIYKLANSSPARCLTGTAEIPLAAMQAASTLPLDSLPRKHAAVSRCYRAEAGARGAQSKGLYRVHEFHKVELFAWCPPLFSTARAVLDEMVEMQIEILRDLGLHCRILAMPCSDLGASASFKIDIEAFFPSRADNHDKGWGEVTSASICTDYQTRRLATRVRLPVKDGKEQISFPFTVNATAVAVPRVLAAVLETCWDEKEECVVVPECLRRYMHGVHRICLDRKPKVEALLSSGD
ncbi:Actin-like protein [Ophiocordyceps camponoti-floridani]|uniref:serine--tRNA ligase n=1 Tax=Ophiocordyceps camponoti-floridani TaxID=2030778 RepID=A0A8H4Q6Q1_9HYPO|nr:Actin-like protein [Ophiocordyceps camponoti-floridani]